MQDFIKLNSTVFVIKIARYNNGILKNNRKKKIILFNLFETIKYF
jgi:hypothetical protein